jgi:macrophage erythroblast attacher
MQELAQDVPWTKHIKSKLMCAMSKTVMEGDNSPFVLPSGVVYGKAAIAEAARASSDGLITCNVSGKPFSPSECVPAYIM